VSGIWPAEHSKPEYAPGDRPAPRRAGSDAARRGHDRTRPNSAPVLSLSTTLDTRLRIPLRHQPYNKITAGTILFAWQGAAARLHRAPRDGRNCSVGSPGNTPRGQRAVRLSPSSEPGVPPALRYRDGGRASLTERFHAFDVSSSMRRLGGGDIVRIAPNCRSEIENGFPGGSAKKFERSVLM
jgi:hypothetical protein